MNGVISVVGHVALDYLFNVEKITDSNESSPIINYEILFGGGAANVAAAIAKLGGEVELIAPIGTDFESSGYKAQLESFGVDLTSLYPIEKKETVKVFVFTDKEHNQSSYFYWGASSEFKNLTPRKCDFVHLSTADPTFNSKISKISNFVSFDPGQDLVIYSKEQLKAILENTDILFANRHELKRMCDMTGFTHSEFKDMIEIMVITYDSKGSMLYTKGEQHKIPIVSVDAVDPTGAGDGYRAGFLVAYKKGYPLITCCKIGSTVASFMVEKQGCQTNLPTWDIMETRFKENFGEL
ncbi:MAG: carbohydrate kinase family protein [Methanosarcinales archaeon]|jgi:ribokinase|nr:carbohydrate kinase family protein [Methanosarcinales archaeon]